MQSHPHYRESRIIKMKREVDSWLGVAGVETSLTFRSSLPGYLGPCFDDAPLLSDAELAVNHTWLSKLTKVK